MPRRCSVDGKAWGLDGDTTSTGAVCIAGKTDYSDSGRRVLKVGDKTTPCPACGKPGVISSSATDFFGAGGNPIALDGTVIICGCPTGVNRLVAPACLAARLVSPVISPSSKDPVVSPPAYPQSSMGFIPALFRRGGGVLRRPSAQLKNGVSSGLLNKGLITGMPPWCGMPYSMRLYRQDCVFQGEAEMREETDFYTQKNAFTEVIHVASGSHITSKPGGAGPVGHYWQTQKLDDDIRIVHVKNGLSGTVCTKVALSDIQGTTLFTSGALSGCTMVYAVRQGVFYVFHTGQKPGDRAWETGRDGVSSLADMVSRVTGLSIEVRPENRSLNVIFSSFDQVAVAYMGKGGNVLPSSPRMTCLNYNERARTGFEIRAAYSYALVVRKNDGRCVIKVITEDVTVGLNSSITVNNSLKAKLYEQGVAGVGCAAP
ncbi:PAAR domain-containing protein [Salmonella enterica]|nr:hypothetical protein [Salmonella enterica]EKK0135226.1 PAAR domain-containing protein [Salmonella enterica]